MEKEDVLTVTFCGDSSNDEAGLAVFRELKYNNGDTKNYMIKMVTGEQADILYRLLTYQEEIVTEINLKSNNQNLKKNISLNQNDILEKHHTCGRCKYEYDPEVAYPCNACIYGTDTRQDLWEEKDEY